MHDRIRIERARDWPTKMQIAAVMPYNGMGTQITPFFLTNPRQIPYFIEKWHCYSSETAVSEIAVSLLTNVPVVAMIMRQLNV